MITGNAQPLNHRYEIREFKKTKQRHLKKIAELKLENRELKHQALEVIKTQL